jgi:prepilin-type N-terminal cleavage/methylation domain-containing protein
VANNPSKLQVGFTLIEMVVVLAVVAIITAIILTSLPSFRDNVSIDLTAQNVATTIREGQIYGMAELGVGYFEHAQILSRPWALHFEAKSDNSSNQFWSFVYYAEEATVDTFSIDSSRNVYKLDGGITVEKLFRGNRPVSTIDLKFQARYPEPKCFGYYTDPNDPNTYNCDSNAESVWIVLYSPREKRERIVNVSSNGQISILPPNTNVPE